MLTFRVADQAWVATALLTRENPKAEGFRVRDIVERAAAERFTDILQPGVQAHVSQHAVAGRPAQPGNYRFLVDLGGGLRRLYRRGDAFHPSRARGKELPSEAELPEQYRELLRWYRETHGNTVTEEAVDHKPTLPARQQPAISTLTGLVIPTFAELANWLNSFHTPPRCFSYSDPAKPFNEAINRAFKDLRGEKYYGIYLIHDPDSGEVLYVGKGGTVRTDGSLKAQDVPARLRAVRDADVSTAEFWADKWDDLGKPFQVDCYRVEGSSFSPAYIEAVLLQAYLSENGRLPRWNTAF